MKKLQFSLLAFGVGAALASQAIYAVDVSVAGTTWTATGSAGIISGDSTVPNSPTGNGQFGYVTTADGVYGTSSLVLKTDGKGSETQTNGSKVVSSTFSALAGDTLSLLFNYVSTDGRGYDDYAWARLVTAGTSDTAAWLFTARSTNNARGNVVPGDVLKRQVDNSQPSKLDAVLNNGDSIGFDVSSTLWDPLGFSSGWCWDAANTCGPSGWIHSDFTFAADGSYLLEFGVVNWGDEAFDTALAFDFTGLQGANFSNVTVNTVPAPVPEPETWALMLAGIGLMGFVVRRRRSAAVPR
jgi:hypothetical protein